MVIFVVVVADFVAVVVVVFVVVVVIVFVFVAVVAVVANVVVDAVFLLLLFFFLLQCGVLTRPIGQRPGEFLFIFISFWYKKLGKERAAHTIRQQVILEQSKTKQSNVTQAEQSKEIS